MKNAILKQTSTLHYIREETPMGIFLAIEEHTRLPWNKVIVL